MTRYCYEEKFSDCSECKFYKRRTDICKICECGEFFEERESYLDAELKFNRGYK